MTFHKVLDLVDQVGLSGRADLNRPDPYGRTVVLTFDDATADHAVVGEELYERGIAAIFFVIAGRLGRPGYLSTSQLEELVSQGHAVGSHALDHIPLDGLLRSQLRDQLARSKALLEDLLGLPIRYFAAPGGVSHPALTPELTTAGYSACRSMNWGFYRSLDQRLWVPCLPITERMLGLGLKFGLVRWRVPLMMRAAWLLKTSLPRSVTAKTRNWMHGSRVPNDR